MKMSKSNLKNMLELKNITENKAELYFYGDIVSSWWGAWDDTDQYPESVKKFLDGAKGKNLDVYINSGGGSVFAGITIYNMLKNHDGIVTVYVDGVAASIASVIALSGDKVIMRKGSALMIHKPLYGLNGGYNADELKKLAMELDRIQVCIMDIYKENLREGIDISTISKLVNKETWLTGDEPSKYFNIEIENELEAVACNSDYLEKYSNIPPSINNFKDRLEEENKYLKAKLNLLKLGGKIYEE